MNLFAVNADTSLPPSYERNVTTFVFAGSVIIFNCTLGSHCVSQAVTWKYYPSSPAGSLEITTWFNGRKVHPGLEWRGVTVEVDGTRGWSMLTIPRVRLADRGKFQCYMDDRCRTNFYLTVTRK